MVKFTIAHDDSLPIHSECRQDTLYVILTLIGPETRGDPLEVTAIKSHNDRLGLSHPLEKENEENQTNES